MSRSLLLLSAAGVALFACPAFAQTTEATESVTVTAEMLAAARNGIQTQTGASTYTITAKDIQNQPGGDNAALNSVILQAPGVAQDSFGQLHIRGEHNGLQYRLNGIILPEGISVFGQTLDPRLAENVRLITGALPAEYGLRTAGIIDIQTKSGVFDDGGAISIYGGSHSTLSPSIAYGGSSGHFNYFVSGDYTTNTLGIESPDGSVNPRHDRTNQYHGFVFAQDILDQNSSVSAVFGTSNAIFQIPDQTGLQAPGLGGTVGLGPLNPGSGNFVLNANGVTGLPSENLDERQREITHYSILSYLHSAGQLDYQVSLFGRYSSLFFTPGNNVGDILYNGIAQTAYKRDVAYGTQAEGAWHGWTDHTIRFGVLYQADDTLSRTASQVLATAPGGVGNANPNPLCTDPAQTCQTSATPLTIADNGSKHGYNYGLYVQDEWALTDKFTINYGLRYDAFAAFDKENQLSPRVNGVWKPTDTTTIHAGYARYFSPPPFELVATTSVGLFSNTTAAPAGAANDTPKAERADIKLQPVQIPRNVKIMAAGAVLLVLLGIGIAWFLEQQREAEEADRARQEEALRLARQQRPNVLQNAPEPVYDRKWEAEPPALDIVKACRSALDNFPSAWEGWRMSALKCDGHSVVVTWGRNKGYSAPQPDWVINDSAQSATQTTTIAALPARDTVPGQS